MRFFVFPVVFVILLMPQIAHAQRTITLDNEGCVLGLEALGNLIGGSVKAGNTPQKIGGRCRAETVSINGHGVSLQIERMEWSAGSLTTLASGKMPAALRLTLNGAHVMTAPAGDPVLTMLAAQPQGMDAELLLGFSSSENALTLHRAQVDFQNNNVVTLNAIFGNVSPLVPGNPLLGMASYLLNDLTLTISNGLTTPNPVWKILQSELDDDAPEKVGEVLSTTLNPSDLSALQTLITDLPRPTGTVRLTVNSSAGYALLRLALVRRLEDLKTALSDLEIQLTYGANSN